MIEIHKAANPIAVVVHWQSSQEPMRCPETAWLPRNSSFLPQGRQLIKLNVKNKEENIP